MAQQKKSKTSLFTKIMAVFIAIVMVVSAVVFSLSQAGGWF